MRSVLIAIYLLGSGANAAAQAQATTTHVRAALVVGAPSAEGARVVTTTLLVAPGWHIYAREPGTTGVPTRFEWAVPPGWKLRDERWPAPHVQLSKRDTTWTYDGMLTVRALLSRTHSRGQRRLREVGLMLSYGVCREVCIPERLTLSVTPDRW